MSKTKAELLEQVDDLEGVIEDLTAQLKTAGVEEIPEHGHSVHESKAERQNRLRSRHIANQLENMQPA